MIQKILMSLSLVLPTAFAVAKGTEGPVKKSQYNANIYEKESNQSQFADVVKVIREIDGATEVVFTKFGTYTAPEDGTAFERLQESQKAKLPVTVTFSEDSRKILKVGQPQKPEEKKSDKTSVPK